MTVTRGTIPNGTIVLRDGKIAALGANVTIPSGAEVIDVTGKFISPGIIDAHSHIAADAINEGGTVVSSMVSIQDVLDPTDINIYRDLAGGLTIANVLHGSANPIGGGNAVIKLRWGKKRGEDLLFEGALTGIKFALGENPKRQGNPTQPNQAPRYPATRGGVEYVIRDAFTRAKAYQKSWQEYEKTKAANKDALPPRRDLQLDPLVEVLEGKRLVHAHCYRADEILMLIRLAEEMGFKIATFQHVLEGYKVAKEIAAHGAGASTFSDWWGYKIEAEDAIPYNAALMHQKGVLVSINSDSAEHARRLNTEAAKTIKWGGLSQDEALAMVTINPAKQLRIDNKVGSLEVGKDADVVVWTAHPLSSFAVADRVYIDGILYHDREADARRITDLEKEKATLRGTSHGSRRRRTAAAGIASSSGWTQLEADVERFRGGPTRDVWPTAQPPSRVRRRRRPQVPTPPGSPGPNDVIAITNARIVPVTKGTIERGTIIIRGNKIAEVGAERAGPGRRESHRREGRLGVSGLHRDEHRPRAQRAGRARDGRRHRDARLQPEHPHARRVPGRQRRDPHRARQRRDDGGGDAERRHPVGRRRGDEPGRMDVGRSHRQAERRHRLQLPGGGGRRRTRRRRRRRTRRRRRRRRHQL